MEESVIQLFQNYPQSALLISLCLNIVIAVLGVIPSVFITAANILFFGFWQGTAISFLGEVLGAAISFLLYRKGFKKVTTSSLQKFPKLMQLLNAQGKEAFLLIFSLRLIPFVPSGLVTFAGAIGKVSIAIFLMATLIGKAPALLMEAYSVNEVLHFSFIGKAILGLTALLLLIYVVKHFRKSK